MHLQFKFEVCKKNSAKRKKLTKYNKKSQNCPKFEQAVLNNVGRPHKKNEVKKKKFFPECLPWYSGKRPFSEQPLPRVSCSDTQERASSPSVFPDTRGRIFVFLSFNGVGGVNRQVTCFFVECRSSLSVALGEEGLCRVLLFTKC